MQAAFQRNLAVLSDGIKVSNANTALIAKALVMEASRNGTEPNKILQKLADEPIDVIARSLEGRTGTLIERIDALEVRSLSSNAAILRSRHVSELFQAIVVVLGTLQGGFGAHFHRLMG
jgi:hypothetical protein